MTTVFDNVDVDVQDPAERTRGPERNSPQPRPNPNTDYDPAAQRRLLADLALLERRRYRLRAT